MIDTLKKMYRGYGFDEAIGISYFSKFLEELKSNKFSEIFLFQSKTYDLNYVFEFLLSTPSLWINLLDVDWIEIMNCLNPRQNPFRIELNYGDFADIHFLAKYLRVNSIEVFLNQDRFSNLDKKYVLQYCRRNACFFSIHEIDLEDLDGELFVSAEELRSVKSRLISGGIFSEFNFDDEYDLGSYLDKQLAFLNLVQEGREITVTNFALSAQISLEEAKQFLDQKAK